MIGVELVQVNLPPLEAERFIQFQKHHDKLVKLLDCGMFEIKNGYAVLHFDPLGNIRDVERHDKLLTS